MKARIVKKRKKSRVEQAAIVISMFSIIIFALGIVVVQTLNNSIHVSNQKSELEIDKLEKELNNLYMQKDDLTKRERVAAIAQAMGLEYRIDGSVLLVQGD